jgi:aspartate ammonia-lyase
LERDRDWGLPTPGLPKQQGENVQTLRALENFRISGAPLRHYPELIQALAMVKMAAARANHECKQFSSEVQAVCCRIIGRDLE